MKAKRKRPHLGFEGLCKQETEKAITKKKKKRDGEGGEKNACISVKRQGHLGIFVLKVGIDLNRWNDPTVEKLVRIEKVRYMYIYDYLDLKF